MPARRPSASTGHTNPIQNLSKAHRSNESHHAFTGLSQPPSIAYSSASATPQQKIVQALINRIRNKLSCYSGLSLDIVEADVPTQRAVEALVELSHDSLDIIAWSLSELLERLAKQTDADGHLTVEVLQSQLFILKILSVAMASRWQVRQEENSRSPSYISRNGGSSDPPPDSSTPPSFMRNGTSRHGLFDPSSSTPPSDVFPLDDNCARYVLSVMVLYLRQTAPPETRLVPSSTLSPDSSLHDFESVDLPTSPSELDDFAGMGRTALPPHIADGTKPTLRLKNSLSSFQSAQGSMSSSALQAQGRIFHFEKTHMTLTKSSLSLNILIGKFAGRIVYHLSASNWMVVFYRIRSKIRFLASTSEENPDTVDLHLMTHSALDKSKLVMVLHELSSLLLNIEKDLQASVAIPLRVAIWNWIDLYPEEFNDAVRSKIRLEGAPERVFDLLYSGIQPGKEKSSWPTLAILSCLSPDRLVSRTNGVSNTKTNVRKDMRFAEDLSRHANTLSKLSEVSFICALDICRAAFRTSPEGDTPLRALAADIVPDVKFTLYATAKQKPFWETFEEIDVATFAEALVCIFRFLPEEESIPLFATCLEPERSDAVKICVFKAAMTLIVEASRFPWQRQVDNLRNIIAPRLRGLIKATSARRSEVDQHGNIKRPALRPRAKRFTSETLADRDLMLLAIMALSRADPNYYITDVKEGEVDDVMQSTTRLWDGPVDTAVKISVAAVCQHMTEIFFGMHPTDRFYGTLENWIKRATTTILISVVNQLILTRLDTAHQRLWMTMAYQIIETYGRKSQDNHAQGMQLSEERVPAFALSEIAFLVSLTATNPDVSQLAAQGLRLIAQAERQIGAPVNQGMSEEDRSKRNPIYEQLGDPNVVVIGRVGQQKRIRKLLRLVAYPSPIHIAVWEECFWRWSALSEFVVQAPLSPVSAYDEVHLTGEEKNMTIQDKFFYWRNLTLLLAAFGGACVQDRHDSSALGTVIPPTFLVDQMRVQRDPRPLVTTFIHFLTGALVDEDLKVRDVAREALGSELSPGLYAQLFQHLDDITRKIVQGAGSEFKDDYSLYLDQLIFVLKSLLESADRSADEPLLADIVTSLMQTLATFISRFNDPAAYRIKIKFCALCEGICDRMDVLTLRKEDLTRNRILDVMVDWIQDTSELRNMDCIGLQSDLNLAALRSAVTLLDRLKLRPIDSSVNDTDDSVHAVHRLFIRYSQILLTAIDICQTDGLLQDGASDVPSLSKFSQRDAQVRDLVISGLSRLILSHSENGFKHCIAIGYETDMKKRAIFVHVFARVIGQGTEFEPQNNVELKARRDRLCELMRGYDMILPIVICEVCPQSEVDLMISVLMNFFDTRTSLMTLLKLLIDREISQAENDSSLFRGNSTCTRFLSMFAKTHGYHYLRSLIIPLVKTMTSLPPGFGYELDPAKATPQEIEENQKNVIVVATKFLEIITSSVPALPSMFREVCAYLAKSVHQVWPEAKFSALGAFIFLRFISPAVVSPKSVDIEVPKDQDRVILRGLMVIAKVVQNLANNILFGKEAHMTGLNTFLENNIGNVTRYLSEVNKYSAELIEDEPDEWFGNMSDDTDTIVLHRFLNKHADRIGKELLSYTRPGADESIIEKSGKHLWDDLCATLVELQNGQPPEVPHLSPLSSSEHREFIDLMHRCAQRNTDLVSDIFVEAVFQADSEEHVIFVLRVCKLDVEILDIELFMYYTLKTILSPQYGNRKFELILDCTSFASTSELPIQWLKTCTELIPSNVRSRFHCAHFLNPNALTQKYLRRIYNVSAGTALSSGVRECSSVAELLEGVPETCLHALEYPASLEAEPHETFTEVIMRQPQQIRMPVIIDVALTHIRITSVRAQTISSALSCRSTEIIPLGDISDAYNVSTGQDPYEFIIRRSRQGVTSYFSSQLRDNIVKTIRAAKSQLRDIQSPTMDKFPRFTNISATLLHVSMVNIDSEDEELRGAAYDLLGAVCTHLDYGKNPIVTAKAGILPGDMSTFVTSLSEDLALFAPRLTLDFISVVCAGMEKASANQRINCLHYMSPWLRNLPMFSTPTNGLYEHSGARLRDCIRSLVDLTMADLEISSVVQKCVWMEIGQLDTTVINVVLDELVRTASDGGIGSRRSETIVRTAAAISSIHMRGRIFAKLRKVLGKTSLRPSKTLAENLHWTEIATLIRFAFIATVHSRQHIHDQIFTPDMFHVVTLVAGTGQTLVRKSVYGLVMNYVQSTFLDRGENLGGPELRALIDELSLVENLRLFGLTRQSVTSGHERYDPPNDKALIDSQEALTYLLIRIMEVVAGSKGVTNVWRARWMSLATSTAFQLPAAIQSRAFIVLGALATSDVDDDLVYQMLVAFKTALIQSSESDTMPIVSMLRCICKVVPSLTTGSRYLCQLFWLAVALLQSSYTAFYAEGADLLRATIETLEKHGSFKDATISSVLLEGRASLEESVSQLDHVLSLSFDASFSFALSSIIFKGVRHSQLLSSAEMVLRSLLSVSVRCGGMGPSNTLCTDAIGYFVALLPFSTTRASFKHLLENCKASDILPASGFIDDNEFVPRVSTNFVAVCDQTQALFLVSFVGSMLATAQGDDAETEILYTLLLDVGQLYPDVLSMAYDSLQDRIKDTFAQSSKPAIIKVVSNIFHVVQQDPLQIAYLRSTDSMQTLNTADEGRALDKKLAELNMLGLATGFQFLPANTGNWSKITTWISELVLKIVGLE